MFQALKTSLVFATMCATSALALDPRDSVKALNMEKLEQLAAVAHAGTDPRVTASLPEVFAESGPNFRVLPPILISIGKEPAFVYVKERFGSGEAQQKYMTFVMRCRGSGIVDIAYNLWSNLQDSDPQRQRSLNQFEPRRVCRRLQLLSRMEHHEQDDEQVFP